MEYLEVVVEGTVKAKDLIESNVGVTLDNANEHENADCETEEVEEHEDFFVKDPDNL